MSESGARILHFAVASRRFALPVTEIMEIREVSGATPVPGAPSVIAGIVEIRGRVVTLMDLAEIYSLPASHEGSMMAVQLAEPLGHLGIAIPSGARNLETGEAAEEAVDDVTVGDGAASGEEPFPAREILLSGARPALLLDGRALADYCTLRVRERFRVSD